MIAIHQLADIRRLYDKLVVTTAPEDLFRIPDGFVNHIAWNAAHVVVTQQSLHYRLSGLDPHLSQDLIDRYKKGSGPDTSDEASFREVMESLHQGPKLLAADYQAKKFENFTTYETSAGIKLSSIDDALQFNNIHEGIHIGYILALRKALAVS